MKKYNLPPNHELFISRTNADLLQEMWEDVYQQREEVQDDLNNGRGDMQKLMQRLAALDRAILGEDGEPEDELIDKWERELEQGLIPDLNEGLDGT